MCPVMSTFIFHSYLITANLISLSFKTWKKQSAGKKYSFFEAHLIKNTLSPTLYLIHVFISFFNLVKKNISAHSMKCCLNKHKGKKEFLLVFWKVKALPLMNNNCYSSCTN